MSKTAAEYFDSSKPALLGNTWDSLKKTALKYIEEFWVANKVPENVRMYVFSSFFAQVGKSGTSGATTHGMSLGNVVCDIIRQMKPELQMMFKYEQLREILNEKGKERKGDFVGKDRHYDELTICRSILCPIAHGEVIILAADALFQRLSHEQKKAVVYSWHGVSMTTKETNDTAVWKYLIPSCIAEAKVTSLAGCGNNTLYFTNDLPLANLGKYVSSVFPDQYTPIIMRIGAKEVVTIYMLHTLHANRAKLYKALDDVAKKL